MHLDSSQPAPDHPDEFIAHCILENYPGRNLLDSYLVGSITPNERAELVSQRIADLATNPFRFTDEIVLVDSENSTNILIVLAFLVAFPHIPGSESDAFRGVSLFLGFLITNSSTAAIANIIAGVIQTYTGAFRVGNVVKIGEVTGIISEKHLLTTRVRTFKNEEVSIPKQGTRAAGLGCPGYAGYPRIT